jgi:predicted RNase H-like HicB family nuclease
LDCGCDRLCPEDPGYAGPDRGEGDGIFQAAWIAGFGQGRPANSVHDPIELRVITLQTGETSVAIVTLDLVGWFYDDTLAVRAAVAAAGADLDLVVVHATHNHEGPDSMGQWGERFGRRGVDEAWRQDVIAAAASAVVEAQNSAVEVNLTVARADSAAPFGAKGTRNTVRDSRDPVVIDEWVGAAQLRDASGGTVATLVNWGNHPEVLGGDNTALTADFVHYLREGVEQGVPGGPSPRAGQGGQAIFLNASVGGLMTPLGITVTDWDGVDHPGETFEKAEALGHIVAGLAIDALASAAGPAEAPRLGFRAEVVEIPVENIGFQALFLAGVFERELVGWDSSLPISATNIPKIRTEVDLIELGPLRILTVPGELFPELAVGGYDGSRVNTEEVPFMDPGNEAPPDLAAAPTGPPLKAQLGVEHAWILGLGNDEIGYLVPPYDYVLAESAPYLSEPPGDHYEETNSLGPTAVPTVLAAAELVSGEPR